MSSWLTKAVLQNVIGRLPKSYLWNGLFQKYVTKAYYPSRSTFLAKIKCCRQHLDCYLKFSPSPRSEFKALEIGTGPWPIVPVGLYLRGASDVWTFDLVPLVRQDVLRRTIELFCESKREGVLEQNLGTIKAERVRHLEELLTQVENVAPVQLLSRLNIHMCIGDARSSSLPDKSVDLIFSTVVLELIGPEILRGMFGEFCRVASPDAVMSHYVGLADQYASFDKSITPFNFLKYTDRQWRVFNNPIIPQNRLRLADYREIFRQSRWGIVEERNTSGSMDDLGKIRLAPAFSRYSTEDLLVLFSWLVARPL